MNTNPDQLLTRAELAAELTAAGYKTSAATLATLASRGGGPPYTKYNGRALVRRGDGFRWAEARATPPAATASEARAAEAERAA